TKRTHIFLRAVSVFWRNVAQIEIVNRFFELCHWALLARHEVEVRRNVVVLSSACKRSAVVLTAVGARDVKPRADDVDRLGKGNRDRCIAWSAGGIPAWVRTQY